MTESHNQTNDDALKEHHQQRRATPYGSDASRFKALKGRNQM
jgi:hypothetical protein